MLADNSLVAQIEPVIDHSLSLLLKRITEDEIACGILAALRRVRTAFCDSGGYSLVSLLDEAVRNRLIIRSLRGRRLSTEATCLAGLPPSGCGSATAETVMVAAIDTCLVYAARDSDMGGMLVVVFLLLDRLIDLLGGVPDQVELLGRLRDGESEDYEFRIERNEVAESSVH